jgi:aspartyl-tRNA(Asn)/glutamyl-tRNA(Gln) amidotransferase subunit C
MAIDRSEVEKIAHLARLQVTAAEADQVADRMSSILALIDKMQAVDTSTVQPLSHPLDSVQPLRRDEITEPDQRDYFQQIAPATEAGLYLVPKVIE